MRSPTQNSLKLLRDEGYHVEVVEHWNHFSQRREDLWGFIDLLALRENEVLGVQTTSLSNISSRIRKITEHPNLPALRKAGVRIECHGWGKRKNRWEVRREDLS